MGDNELKQRAAYFKELGHLLVRRHGQNYTSSSYHRKNNGNVDDAAARFGRYLRAARVNAGLSVAELSGQTKLSKAKLIALEQGLILSDNIKTKWLRQLSKALSEDIEDFNLILGRGLTHRSDRFHKFTEPLAIQWQKLPVFTKILLLSNPVYTTFSALLLCLIMGTFLFFDYQLTEQPPPRKKSASLIIVDPEHRLNIIKAEWGFENQAFALTNTVRQSRSCCIR